MADLLSAADQSLLKSAASRHHSVNRLYVFGTDIVWKGRVNDGSPTRGMQSVAYDGGALQGDFDSVANDIQAGIVVEFGTTDEDNDLGTKRLLSFGSEASGTMVIEWHDDMLLTDNAYITIRNHYPPAPKFSHFTTATGVHKDGPPAASGGAGEAFIASPNGQTQEPPPHVKIGLPLIIDGIDVPNDWWLTDTITSNDVVAAYQGVGATSQADSLKNLAKLDSNDLVEQGSPTWTAAAGWSLNGSTQWLETAFNIEYQYTVMVAVAFPQFNTTRAVFGIRNTTTNTYFYEYIQSSDLGGAFQFTNHVGHGADTVDSTVTTWSPTYPATYVAGLTFNKWLVTVSGSDPDPNTFTGGAIGTTGSVLYIGDMNGTLPGGVGMWADEVVAIAVYNRPLTNAEFIAIENQMAAIQNGVTGRANAYPVDASRSNIMAPGAAFSTHAWTVSPSSLGSFSNAATQTTEFVPAEYGQGVIHYTGTDDESHASTAHRTVIVEDPTNPVSVAEFEFSDIPHQVDSYNIRREFTLTSPDTGSPSKGANPDTDWDAIGRLTQVIQTQRDYWDGIYQAVTVRSGSQYNNRRHVRYAGYVTGERREIEPNGTGRITLRCQQAPLTMYGFAQSIQGVRSDDVDAWYKMLGSLMTVEQLAFHYLYYHTTLIDIMDVELPDSDTTLRSAMEEWVAGDLMARLFTGVNEKGRLMTVTITPQGELFVEARLNMMSETDRDAADVVMTLDGGHVIGSGVADVDYLSTTSQVWADGFASPDGILGNGTPLRSVSDNIRLPYGTGTQNYRGLTPADQTELNRWTGRFRDVLNYAKEITLRFDASFWDVLYVAPQKWLNAGDVFAAALRTNLRGTGDLEDVKMVPIQVISRGETIEATFEVEVAEGLTGRTVPIPSVSPYYATSAELPGSILSPPVPAEIVATGDKTNGMELRIPDGTWLTRNGSLTGSENAINSLHRVPFWWIRQQSADANDSIWWRATDAGLWHSDDGGQNWFNRSPSVTSLPGSTTQADVKWQDVKTFPDKTRVGKIVWACAWVLDGSTYTSYYFVSTDYGANWTQHTMTTGDRIFNLAVNPEDETEAWIAFRNNGSGSLQVGRRDDAGATQGTDEDFGLASMAEVDAGTYSIRVKTAIDTAVSGYGTRPFVYGRFLRT